jgi:hypothetical protein
MQLHSFAQTPIAELKDGSTNKAISQSYSVKITDKRISIENINNRFTNIKQNSPKLYGHIPGPPDIVLEEEQLSTIFLKYISRKQLEALVASDIYAGLMIDIRTDIYGKILELDFFTAKNSVLTLQQLEQIENEIKSTKLVTITPETSIRLEGSNYWRLWPFILYDDLLNINQGMERPQQREIN